MHVPSCDESTIILKKNYHRASGVETASHAGHCLINVA